MIGDERTEFLTATPYLHYPNGDGAVDWLTRVFGFGPARSTRNDDGSWYEGEIEAGPLRFAISGGATEGRTGSQILSAAQSPFTLRI